MQFSKTVKEYLGWCPNAAYRKTRTAPVPEPEGMMKTPVPGEPPAPVPVNPDPSEHRPEYQTNLVLILVFLVGLFYATNLQFLIPFSLISAVLVYFDAENIRAGRKFPEVNLLGEVATWRPIVWAAAVFVGSIIFFAIYLFCREEISTANT